MTWQPLTLGDVADLRERAAAVGGQICGWIDEGGDEWLNYISAVRRKTVPFVSRHGLIMAIKADESRTQGRCFNCGKPK